MYIFFKWLEVNRRLVNGGKTGLETFSTQDARKVVLTWHLDRTCKYIFPTSLFILFPIWWPFYKMAAIFSVENNCFDHIYTTYMIPDFVFIFWALCLKIGRHIADSWEEIWQKNHWRDSFTFRDIQHQSWKVHPNGLIILKDCSVSLFTTDARKVLLIWNLVR